MRPPYAAPFLALLIVAACQPQGAPLSAADQTALRADADSFAARVNRADWTTAATEFADDAHLMPPNQGPEHGRAAIEAWLKAFPPVSGFTLTVQQIDGRGDLAYVQGTYTMTVTPPGARPVPDNGKFLAVRRKQANGSWLTVQDMFNSSVPLPTGR